MNTKNPTIKSNWRNDAQKWALQKFDSIIVSQSTLDYIEFKGYVGGDFLVFRYYSDGRITNR